MAHAQVFQIYYSDATRRQLDPGFIPLDNSANVRPDWREYWPMRSFLLQQSLVENDYYSFLSPKFKSKSGLDSKVIAAYMATMAGNVDVVLFSPYFDQGALFWNTLEHGVQVHRENRLVFERCLPLIAPAFQINDSVNTSANTVYCNYFAARPAFWRRWLEKCEQLFAIAEAGRSELAQCLNREVPYENGTVASKTFVIERVASLLLAADSTWRVDACLPLSRWSNEPIAKFQAQLAAMDALKLAYQAYGYQQYRDAFLQIRQVICHAVLREA